MTRKKLEKLAQEFDGKLVGDTWIDSLGTKFNWQLVSRTVRSRTVIEFATLKSVERFLINVKNNIFQWR